MILLGLLAWRRWGSQADTESCHATGDLGGALAFGDDALQGECHTAKFSFYFGQDVPTTMRVTSGAPCSIKMVLGRKSN